MEREDGLATGGSQRVFRAKQKVDQPGFISHITQRAAGTGALFFEPSDYERFWELLQESAATFSLVYYAFCLMPNHVHLLLEPQKPNVSAAMHSVFARYATYCNRKYQRRGHLFAGRYRQAVCLAPDYLLTASVYIHLNPVRARLTNQAAAYQWSSAAPYCGKPEQESFVQPRLILQLVNADLDKARQEYVRLLRRGSIDAPENAQEQPGAIETFCERLGNRFPRLFRQVQGKGAILGDSALPLAGSPSLEELLSEFPRGRATDPDIRRAKQYVLEQLLARGFTRGEIAERLQIARKTVYNLLQS
ncbi:MAG: transposase [Desulfohalobium sp.]